MAELDPLEASQIITDEYAAKILVATSRKGKHAIELSQTLGIPIAACYRRIHTLEKAGLLKCTEVVTGKKGKPIKLYKSLLKRAFVYFERGKLRVRFEFATGKVEEFGTDWSAVDIEELWR